MISHRPRVIQKAEWIILLEAGNVQLKGTFEELIQQQGFHLNFLNP